MLSSAKLYPLVFLAGLFCYNSVTFAALSPVVTQAAIATNTGTWWQGATAVSNASGAQLSKGVAASLLTSLGAANSLPATLSTTVPRATLAAGAAKLLKNAGGVGLAAYALYALLSPVIGLDADGNINDLVFLPSVETACYGYSVPQAGPGTPGDVCNARASACTANAAAYIAAHPNGASVYWSATASSSMCTFTVHDTTAADVVYTVGLSNSTGSSGQAPSEALLADTINNSNVASHDLWMKELQDFVAHPNGIDFGLNILPHTNPVAIAASPVVMPEEVISTQTVTNPDGTTTTVTTKSQVTATPHVSGDTVGDVASEWRTAEKQTQTAVNNATGATTTTVTNTDQGNTTTKQAGNFNCPDCAKETTLQSFKEGTAKTITTKTPKSFTDAPTQAIVDDAVTTAKTEFETKFNEVKSGLSSMFSFTGSGSGQLPTFDYGYIAGVHVVADLNNYSTQLSYVGSVLLFAAGAIAVMILLG